MNLPNLVIYTNLLRKPDLRPAHRMKYGSLGQWTVWLGCALHNFVAAQYCGARLYETEAKNRRKVVCAKQTAQNLFKTRKALSIKMSPIQCFCFHGYLNCLNLIQKSKCGCFVSGTEWAQAKNPNAHQVLRVHRKTRQHFCINKEVLRKVFHCGGLQMLTYILNEKG